MSGDDAPNGSLGPDGVWRDIGVVRRRGFDDDSDDEEEVR